MQHETVDDVLAHYGIRGMKWGVRRTPGPNGLVSRGGGKGKKRGAPAEKSEDAVVFENLKAKAKKGGISSLSNDEIRTLANRAAAIESLNRAFPAKKSRKKKTVDFFVQEVLVGTGKSLVKDVAREAAKKGAVNKGLLPKKDNNKKDD